jgi:NAD(P)-dependent dehydrogenase (short-subunit alcohol dehydrogenase family)
MSENSMQGKTVIVTGANRGLGREMTRQLAAMGAKMIMACRFEDPQAEKALWQKCEKLSG